MNRLKQLHDAGVSIWLDLLSRDLLASGRLVTLINEQLITGATSNPTIFAKALAGSAAYDEQIAAAAPGCRDPNEAFLALALDDVRQAADLLRPVHDATGGREGSSPSSAPPTSPTTPQPRSSRPGSCGTDSTAPTS